MSRMRKFPHSGLTLLLTVLAVAAFILPWLDTPNLPAEEHAGASSSFPLNQLLDGPSAIRSQDLLDPIMFGLFLLKTVFTLGLAALIAFHPIRKSVNQPLSDRMLPKLFLFYALIGMTIGFLVVQHGYTIGFVIFGIGGLLRFRSSLGSPSNTVEVIMVTVIGLCVGLNLSVAALMIALAVWGVLWVAGAMAGFEVRLQCNSEEEVERQIDLFLKHLRDLEWALVSINRSTTKPGASVIFRTGFFESLAGAEREIAAVLDDGRTTWKLKV